MRKGGSVSDSIAITFFDADVVMRKPRPRLYHMLQLAPQRMRKHADEAGIAIAGVSAAQGGAMFVIEAHPGISQRDLARALGSKSRR